MGTFIEHVTSGVWQHGQRLAGEVRSYSLGKARSDAVAGMTVAVVAIPQSLAYAIIAGLESQPQYGLYTVIFQCFIAAFMNSHPLLSVGPINTQSLLVASIVTRLYDPGSGATYLSLVVGLTLLKGLIQLAMGMARMGTLVRYVSRSVIVGFTAGAGLLIAAGQLRFFLGVDAPRVEDAWPGLVGIGQRLVPNLGEMSGYALEMGLLALVLVVGARWISKLMPGPLIAVVVTAVVVYLMDWTGEDLALVPAFERALPVPTLPGVPLHLLEPMLAGALALALLGLMEAYSIGKTLSSKTGDRISANQELASQGATNILSSFLSCIPGSGSFSRSALNHYAGGKTFISSIFASLFILIIFLLFAPAAAYVPMSAIAAILFVVAAGLVDWKYVGQVIRTSRADTAVCLGTFASTLFLPLAYAVFAGIVLNIALYLRRSSQLQMTEMVQSAAGPFMERPLRDKLGNQKVMFVQFQGDLYFALADQLQEQLTMLSHSGLKVVIIRMKRTHWIDTTVMSVLTDFVDEMKERDGHVILCGMRPEMTDRFEHFGLVTKIGRENIFESGYGVFTSAKRAIERAKALVGSSIDEDGFVVEDETEGWAYEI